MTPDRLPCGAPVDQLIEQVADGRVGDPTPHQQGCPHCQAALAEYDRLWAPVHQLAAEPVPVPDGLLEQVLQHIRGVTRHPTYGLLPGPRGHTRIAERVIAVTARLATDRVTGVRAALTHSTATDHPVPQTIAGTVGTSVALQITLAASYGHDLHALAQRVRTAVASAIRDVTGLHAVTITVVIDDILEPEP